MARLELRRYPDPVLLQKAELVTSIQSVDKKLLADMIETMHAEKGVGLAAPQIGVSKQIIVMCPTAKRGEERVLYNPNILKSAGLELMEEGCLSLPGLSGKVPRFNEVTFEAMNEKGEQITETLTDFPARIIQHEVDHLNGRLFIDRLDFDNRQQLLSKYSCERP